MGPLTELARLALQAIYDTVVFGGCRAADDALRFPHPYYKWWDCTACGNNISWGAPLPPNWEEILCRECRGEQGTEEERCQYVIMHKFNNCRMPFFETLMNAKEFASLRKALSEEGHDQVLTSKAKVFVKPHLYQAVVETLSWGEPLQAEHIIMEPELETTVIRIVKKISRPKRGHKQVIRLLSRSSPRPSRHWIETHGCLTLVVSSFASSLLLLRMMRLQYCQNQ